MHPLLPFYGLFSLMALLGLPLRTREERTIVWLAAWGGMLVIITGVIFRDVRGDTERYYSTFIALSQKSFDDLMANSDGNILFNMLNWTMSQLGHDPLWMIMPVTLICLLLLRNSLRQMFGPVQSAVAILLYSVYPFFIFYVASGIKQALAMALLMQSYVCLWEKRWLTAALWTSGAILFHNGALLTLPFIALHLFIWRPGFGYNRALTFSMGLLLVCTFLALTNINQSLLSSVQNYLVVADRYEIYFEDTETLSYRVGFRIDFTLLTFLPFLVAWWLRPQGKGLEAVSSGWWLNLYALLACIYQLFAFAPFADRFGAFSWYIIPAVIMVMLNDTGTRRPMQIVLLVISLGNIVILQFYTGPKLHVSF